MPETTDLIVSLRSVRCPMCGNGKKPAQTMCYGCYKKLPRDLQQALYRRVGAGYEQAFADAMEHLGVDMIFMPSQPKGAA